MEKIKDIPIVVFVYNRLEDTIKTFESLKKADSSKDTILYIFSDGPKEDNDKEVAKVRNYISNLYGFKRIILHQSKENKGLAQSIIEGVSKVFEEYDSIIVLEDDLECSSDFITFMKKAIFQYQNDSRIWSISGYTPRIKIPSKYSNDIFLTYRSSSWGWATWKDRWEKIDWTLEDFESFKKIKKNIKNFNISGSDMFKMLELQKLDLIDSWAIRFCYNQFKRNMLTLYPIESKIRNIGIREGGTHSNTNDSRWSVDVSNRELLFPKYIEIDNKIIKSFKKKYDLDIFGIIGYWAKKNGFYNKLIKYKKYVRK